MKRKKRKNNCILSSYSFVLLGAIECVEVANRTMFGAESSQISALFYLTYVAAAGGIHKLVECDPGSGQESTIQVRCLCFEYECP